jgi:hypothetical protein
MKSKMCRINLYQSYRSLLTHQHIMSMSRIIQNFVQEYRNKNRINRNENEFKTVPMLYVIV